MAQPASTGSYSSEDYLMSTANKVLRLLLFLFGVHVIIFCFDLLFRQGQEALVG